MTATYPIFVYGTLRPGQLNYEFLLAGRTLNETPATLTGATMRGTTGYPYVSLTPQYPNRTVVGDLITLTPETYNTTMHTLDRLEGYEPGGNSHYLRDLTEATDNNGVTREAWVYHIDANVHDITMFPIIASGDWIKWDTDREQKLDDEWFNGWDADN